MARRTKEEAQETRNRILDTAERVFLKSGVSRTSLDDIAEATGVTRGAIYWHFKNKADLFEAMMERVSLPMEDMQAHADDDLENPLDYVRGCALRVLEHVTSDPQSRRVQEICHFKVEYVGEMEQLRARHVECRTNALALVERGLRSAAKKGLLAPGVNPPARGDRFARDGGRLDPKLGLGSQVSRIFTIRRTGDRQLPRRHPGAWRQETVGVASGACVNARPPPAGHTASVHTNGLARPGSGHAGALRAASALSPSNA